MALKKPYSFTLKKQRAEKGAKAMSFLFPYPPGRAKAKPGFCCWKAFYDPGFKKAFLRQKT
jgi:hypothetical protein